MPEGEPAPSWDELPREMSGDLRPPEFQSSGAWAISELRRRLGEGWPERASTPYGLPSGFDAVGFHTIAHCELLELALRLHSLDRLSGRGRVQRALRDDAANSQVMHARIRLELAASPSTSGRQRCSSRGRYRPKTRLTCSLARGPSRCLPCPQRTSKTSIAAQ